MNGIDWSRLVTRLIHATTRVFIYHLLRYVLVKNETEDLIHIEIVIIHMGYLCDGIK